MMLSTFVDSLLFSLLSIGIVILIIGIIVLAITPLKKLSLEHHETTNQPQTKLEVDDEMMAAILVAAIDYRETVNKEPKLISVREINL